MTLIVERTLRIKAHCFITVKVTSDCEEIIFVKFLLSWS